MKHFNIFLRYATIYFYLSQYSVDNMFEQGTLITTLKWSVCDIETALSTSRNFTFFIYNDKNKLGNAQLIGARDTFLLLSQTEVKQPEL